MTVLEVPTINRHPDQASSHAHSHRNVHIEIELVVTEHDTVASMQSMIFKA